MAVRTLSTLKDAIDRLEKGVPQEYYLGMRDSAIQRFEYSIDTFWKFLKIYLQEYMKFDTESASPRAIVRDAVNANMLSTEEFEILMKCITSRNETSHAYNESLAKELISALPTFYKTMHKIIMRITISDDNSLSN